MSQYGIELLAVRLQRPASASTVSDPHAFTPALVCYSLLDAQAWKWTHTAVSYNLK